jgi:polygalacturonase
MRAAMSSTRRQFLRDLAVAAPFVVAPGALVSAAGNQAATLAPWDRAAAFLRRIVPPRFPDRHFQITRFGAVGDGRADCTSAIRRAIAACRAAGGGRVVVPDGRFLTGALKLANGVDLHLSPKATLAFSRDARHYLPVVHTRWEGTELMNYSPFIYAFEAENIAITGTGTLDGQADASNWWNWRGEGGAGQARQTAARDRLLDLGARGVPVPQRVFGEGHWLRPNFIQPYRSRNVLIDGITIINSPMWEIHPVLCQNVTVRNVSIRSHGPNNDGCDPESCRDVFIDGCTFDTGDDCIALKSGRNNDGRRLNVPIENVIIRNCTMKDGHGGVVIGSEISGGARNIFAEQCRMDSPQLDRALRIKTNSVRGGTVEGIYMRDVTVGEVAEAVVTINYFYEEGDAGQFPPVVRDVEVRNVTSRKSKYGLLLRGYAHDPIADVRLIDCRFDGVAEGDVIEAVRDLARTNVVVNGSIVNDRVTR